MDRPTTSDSAAEAITFLIILVHIYIGLLKKIVILVPKIVISTCLIGLGVSGHTKYAVSESILYNMLLAWKIILAFGLLAAYFKKYCTNLKLVCVPLLLVDTILFRT